MLNLSSTDEQLIKELKEDQKHVQYWHIKHYGGKNKYDKWQEGQIRKVVYKEKGYELIGDLVDYHSLRSGNRWKSFEVTRSYGSSNAYTSSFSFCYYDTYGSVGSFMYMKTPSHNEFVLVFTSHFFLRYADRMDIKYRDAQLVSEFYLRNHVLPVKISEEEEDGKRQIIIAAKEGVCYGVVRTPIHKPEDIASKPVVCEIRTFLTYEQLNGRQKRDVETLLEDADLAREMFDTPEENIVDRVLSDDDLHAKMMDKCRKMMHLSKSQFNNAMALVYAVQRSTGDLFKQISDTMSKSAALRERSYAQSHNLMEMCAEVARRKDHPGNVDVAKIIHKLKGDNYDWNKWLYKYVENIYDSDCQEVIDSVRKKCINRCYDYHTLVSFLKSVDSHISHS